MGFLEDLESLLSPVFAGLDALFGDEEPAPPRERVREVVPAAPSWSSPPRAPGPPWAGSGGLRWGADQAAGTYQHSSGAVTSTDDKLAKLLKDIFTTNDETRARVSELVAGIQAAHRKIMTDPTMSKDPQALACFNTMLDQDLAEIARLLNSAKVDSKKQAELLAALGDQYRDSSGEHPRGATDAGGSGGGAGVADAGSGGGADGGGADSGTGTAGVVTDPLAGLGSMPGGLMGDPLSMLGPALGALGSLPGALGGAGGSVPMDALGALAPLAGALGGHGDSGNGFTDDGARERGKPADFVDDPRGHGEGSEADEGTGKSGGESKPGPAAAGSADVPPVAAQPGAAAAAPASAPGGDGGLVVQMPDGTPVTATSPQHAAVVRAVLNGASVTDAWKPYAQLPPPGTPVTMPADPNHLVPGQVAQCKSREPIVYMGNGKIWLDGQLQPQSALPAGEFLGWEDPMQFAGTAGANVPAALSPTSPSAGPAGG